MCEVPDLSRTKLCKKLINTGACDDPECTYAHNRDELRVVPGFNTQLAAAASAGSPNDAEKKNVARSGTAVSNPWPQQSPRGVLPEGVRNDSTGMASMNSGARPLALHMLTSENDMRQPVYGAPSPYVYQQQSQPQFQHITQQQQQPQRHGQHHGQQGQVQSAPQNPNDNNQVAQADLLAQATAHAAEAMRLQAMAACMQSNPTVQTSPTSASTSHSGPPVTFVANGSSSSPMLSCSNGPVVFQMPGQMMSNTNGVHMAGPFFTPSNDTLHGADAGTDVNHQDHHQQFRNSYVDGSGVTSDHRLAQMPTVEKRPKGYMPVQVRPDGPRALNVAPMSPMSMPMMDPGWHCGDGALLLSNTHQHMFSPQAPMTNLPLDGRVTADQQSHQWKIKNTFLDIGDSPCNLPPQMRHVNSAAGRICDDESTEDDIYHRDRESSDDSPKKRLQDTPYMRTPEGQQLVHMSDSAECDNFAGRLPHAYGMRPDSKLPTMSHEQGRLPEHSHNYGIHVKNTFIDLASEEQPRSPLRSVHTAMGSLHLMADQEE